MSISADPTKAVKFVLIILVVSVCQGCQKRVAVDRFPPGVHRVEYVPATSYTECLLASAVMCANYVTASNRLSVAEMRDGMAAQDLDATRIGDVALWLNSQRLTLKTLVGDYNDQELVGLGWWLGPGRYPVICVMNKHAGNAEYNHAVVVIGIRGSGELAQAEKIFVLDPASPRRLEEMDPVVFQHYWNCAGRVMLPLFETPVQAKHTHKTGA